MWLALFPAVVARSADGPAGVPGIESLDHSFLNPPDDAKPRVYWFWVYNRVDKAAITLDLEQFKAKGISGVNLISTGGYAGAAPLPGVKYQSPEWWDLIRFAAKEAKRLNIEFGFNLSAGGWVMEAPWVTPENAMKKVVQADLSVQGPVNFSAKLPQPEIVDGYYHDYCVQAFPHVNAGTVLNPKDIIDLTDRLKPDGELQWSVPNGKWTILRTGYTLTGGGKWHAYPDGDTYDDGGGYQIDYLSTAALDDHFKHLGIPVIKAVREAGGDLAYLWSDSWECGKLTWTQDFPNQFRKYRGYDIKPYLPLLDSAISYVDYSATFTATAGSQTLSFTGTDLRGGDNTVFIDNVQVVSSARTRVAIANASFETPSVQKESYNPADGAWTFSGASPDGSGICPDGSNFHNPNAPDGKQVAFIQAHGTISQTISGLTPGTTYTISFSAGQRPGNYETWNVSINDKVIESCKPGAGVIIRNEDVTARFRDDFDRTIQDCLGDNFYGHFTELCHQNGLINGSEAAGPNNIPPEDALKNLGRCDFPAGEFWVHYNATGGYDSNRMMRLNLKQTATAAHVYGHRQAEAESFTQMETNRTHWSLGPADLKPYANDAFCAGINRLMLHQCTCQPPSDGKPGYEFCAGQHFNPNITWWEQSPAFFTFLSRCSYMLQQGNFSADVCFYLGERPPLLAPPKYNDPALGAGYDCDYCNSEVLLTRMSVKDGRIVLPDGTNYRLLDLQNCVSPLPAVARQVGNYQSLVVSPVPSKAMSVEVIQKLRELVTQGATVIGAPPESAAGLRNYPQCDADVTKIASEMWGDLDGKTRTQRTFGKGRIIWGKSPREVLLADHVGPDFSYTGQADNYEDLDYIHRTTGESEIYYVINRKKSATTRNCTFRVIGKQPEIFDPVSGVIRPATAFHQEDASTTLPLEFDRYGSCFVVFRKPIGIKIAGGTDSNFPKLSRMQELGGPWSVSFDPAWGGPAQANFPELINWTKSPDEGIRNYSGKATYRKTFDLADPAKSDQLFLDLGDVRSVAEVRLNGQKLGILWCFPWRVDITNAVKATGNELEVDVVNLWPNRVIADLNLPKEKRLTKTHDVFRFDEITKNTTPIDSGLLGPVAVLRRSD